MKNKLFIHLVMLLILISLSTTVHAAGKNYALPTLEIGVTDSEEPEQVATSIRILFILTILSLAPAILILMTSFTRTVIVLSFIRNGLATQQMPPNQVLIGLALFITFFVMAPTWNQVNDKALQPYLNGELSQDEAIQAGLEPIREFMFKYTREKDIALFLNYSEIEEPETQDDVPTLVLIPAFVISELKTAFQIGFIIFIPFLVIDMVVASTLMSMGMMMLPPVMISLPFKILLFVLADGWNLVIRSLLHSF
ncbi:flagellar biosynthetic protein FliP [Anaerobranca gottschalkii DSM 13577]|uniref:Flagellar biosynthetic protein FliP n=2 Tax=Anaerobranca gottschalkii TaxID=108328 RepID=A0A1H9ZCQ9_9FIRM|nr:flagellar biosynthetic protein FliP [Anaerobranca gottschalkii DSM 13577]